MPISELDPSMAVAFYCDTRDSFESFGEEITEVLLFALGHATADNHYIDGTRYRVLHFLFPKAIPNVFSVD